MSRMEDYAGDAPDEHQYLINEKTETPTPIEPVPQKSRTVMNIWKANLGSGILGMPFAFSQGGLWGGLIGMPIICVLCLYCSKMLVDCKNELHKRDSLHGREIEYSFGGVGHACFGKKGLFIVDLFVSFTLTGFSCAYVIFIATNMNDVFEDISAIYWSIICLPCLWLLCCLRTLKYLAPFSTFANLALLFGIGVVFYNSLDHIDKISERKGFNWSGLPVFFGMAVYSYEGIGLVIPIEQSMRKPSQFLNIFFSSMGCISAMLVALGFLGYLRFGDITQGSITANLPDSTLTNVVRGLLSFSLLMTFPVQMFPVLEILENYLVFRKEERVRDFVGSNFMFEALRNLLRVALVTIVVAVAIGVPYFGLFVGLIGSLGSAFLAFCIPVMFHLKLFGSKMSYLGKFRDIFIFIFGVIGGGVGTLITIQDLVDAFKRS